MVSTVLVPVNVTTSRESHRIPDTEVTNYKISYSWQADVAKLTCRDNFGTLHLYHEGTEFSDCPAVEDSLFGLNVHVGLYWSDPLDFLQGARTLVIDAHLTAYHELGRILPVKWFPMIFVLVPSIALASVIRQ